MPHVPYKIKYIKENKEHAERVIVPIGFNHTKRNVITVIDLSGLSESEINQEVEILSDIRRRYLDELIDSGFKDTIRQLYLDKVEW